MLQFDSDEVRLSSWTSIIPESEIRRLLRFHVKYYFAGGKPGVIPVSIFTEILESIAREFREKIQLGQDRDIIDVLNYAESSGWAPFKKVLARRLRRDGVPLPNDDEEAKDKIAITVGSQQALYILADIFIDPGDVVITTEPAYLGFLGPVMRYGANVVTVPTDEKGIIPEFVEEAIEKSIEVFKKKPDFVYVIADSDNPKGTTLPTDRRKKLYEIAENYRIYLVEDAAYREIQFEDRRPTIKSFDKDNQWVIFTRSTSKEAAVLRVGYTVLPDRIIDEFIKAKGYIDLNTPLLTQYVLKRYYEKYIDEVIANTVKEYERRCRVMEENIDEHFPPGFRTKPTGGFFIWWESEKLDFDAKAFLEKVALKNDLSYVPGEAFYPLPHFAWKYDPDLRTIEKEAAPRKNTMRLSYSYLTPEEIEVGIQRLGRLLSDHLK